ncbi:MAG TPA: LCP family protein [Dehalococcoidia bacterium]|nr:LCP family protein [Dehalococcoidia bacterium]
MSEQPRRDAARPSTRRPRLRNQILFVFGILVLASGAFYTALVVATQIDHIFFPGQEINLGSGLAKLPGIDKKPTGPEAGPGGRINVLVMGLDRRKYEGAAPARTDTMFVMTIDPSSRTARGLAMPRDLFVDIPSKTGNTTFKERINSAYVIGELQNYPGGGAALARQTVEKLLGLKINYHVLIDFEGFKQVIDLLGGIDVDVAAPGVNDPEYSDTERLRDFYPCVFAPGPHHMDGKDALCYSRVRRNSSDLDRITRQQRVMFAVMDKASQLNVLADPRNAVNLWERYKSTITTDINDLQIPGFANLARSIDPEKVSFLSVGAATLPYTVPSTGAAVLLPSQEGIKQIVEAFMSDNRLQAEAATVEVQNGTDLAGQATKAVDYLTQLGIPRTSLFPANALDSNHPKSEIIDFSGKPYTADRLAGWLSLPKDRVRKGSDNDAALRTTQADIVVILGQDAKLESAVAAPPAR